MANHSASIEEEKRSRQESQVREVNEAHSNPADDCPQDPPKEWFKKIRWNEVLQTVAVLVGIAVCGIYWEQLQVMTGQLREMQESSSQTSQLIVNAAHQANETHDLAVSAGKQANAAKSVADTAARSLELSERPWVSIDFKSMFITKPLMLNSNGASMYIGYSWKNTGHSPAMHIHSQNKLIVLSMTKLAEAEAAERQAALCDPLRKLPRWHILEITIFPDDAFPFNEGLGLDQGEIAAGLKSRESGPASHPGYISLALVGCIDYQFSFAPEHHQTRYAFWVGIPGPLGLWKSDLKPEGVQPDVKLI